MYLKLDILQLNQAKKKTNNYKILIKTSWIYLCKHMIHWLNFKANFIFHQENLRNLLSQNSTGVFWNQN